MLYGRKFTRSSLISGLILLALSFGTIAQEPVQVRIQPVDESDRDPSLIQFMQRLREAVKHREPERLVELVSPRVFNGVGKESGVGKFAEIWRIDAIDSEIWSVLEPMLVLGGGFVRSEKGVQYCAPYVFTEFPDNLDPYEHGAIIEDTSELRSEPSSSSTLVSSLSYHVVKVPDWQGVPDMNQTPNLSWVKVTTLDGQEGFVRRSEIRSPAEYTACFLQNKRGVWKLTSLFSQID